MVKVRIWQKDVANYLRRWRKLKEQAFPMEMWVVTEEGEETGENVGLGQLLKDSYKKRRALTSKQSINSTGSNDNLFQHFLAFQLVFINFNILFLSSNPVSSIFISIVLIYSFLMQPNIFSSFYCCKFSFLTTLSTYTIKSS